MSSSDSSPTTDVPRTVAMTGAGGFLGWHTRAALLETGTNVAAVRVGANFALEEATEAIDGAPRLIHIAGVNRGSEDDILAGNVGFADQIAAALRRADTPPAVVVNANSIQAGNGSAYGGAKARAADLLAAAAQEVGSQFIDLKLPNIFGEHGKPFYNSVTATFCHLISRGKEPTVEHDKELTLLHAQNAADLLTGAAAPEHQEILQERESVSGLLGKLRAIAVDYGRGEIPDIAANFDRDLFNTFRSYSIEAHTPISLTRNADFRGAFFEVVRSHGGRSQSSFSTTAPGISRGNHVHRRKIERFVVLSGQATISLRRLFTDEVRHFEVHGDIPMAIDMPTMWAHSITNTGSQELFTSFWTNDLFDPLRPDTIAEAV